MRARRRLVPAGASCALLAALGLAVPAARARVTLTCPADVVVECDGAGNVVEHDAWRAGFEARATGGCDPVVLTLTPGGSLIPTLSFTDFSDLSAWTLNGITGLLGNPVFDGSTDVLRLTNGLSQSGSAFVSNPISLIGDASFSAFFAFRISNPQGIGDADGPGADGIVFVIQTVSDTAGGLGGGIGYQGIAPSIGVELDTYNNGAWDRNDGNHVGIDENGNVTSVQQATVARRLNDGNPWYAWVDYDGVLDLLDVRLSDVPIRPALPTLSHVVDLPGLLGTGDAFVGFTSGTGGGGGDHDILSLLFSEGASPFGCGGEGSETVLATATDACGDTQACTHSFTIVDSRPPALARGAIATCFATAAEAEAAALAATGASDVCSPPVLLTATTTGTCTARVTVAGEDGCGNSASIDYSAQVDATPPVFTTCPTAIVAVADGPDGALVPVVVAATDGCSSPRVVNNRTAGGVNATDRYPCGLTLVVFVARDACGNAAECEVLVHVEAAWPAPPVGPVLRVRRDAAGRPRLTWTGAAAAPSYAVLLADIAVGEWSIPPTGWDLTATSWTDPAADGRLLFYDVRSVRCDAGLSDD